MCFLYILSEKSVKKDMTMRNFSVFAFHFSLYFVTLRIKYNE